MSSADQRNKSQAMAADLLKRGIFHGKRMTKPHKDSGGIIPLTQVGSSKYRRWLESRGK